MTEQGFGASPLLSPRLSTDVARMQVTSRARADSTALLYDNIHSLSRQRSGSIAQPPALTPRGSSLFNQPPVSPRIRSLSRSEAAVEELPLRTEKVMLPAEGPGWRLSVTFAGQDI